MLTPDEVAIIKDRVDNQYIGAGYAWSQVYHDLQSLLATIAELREELEDARNALANAH